jgi:hypothetical protein
MVNDENGRMSEWRKSCIFPSLKYGFIIPVLILVSFSASATDVNVEHSYVTVGDVFSVNVNCFPTQPVKGWEFKVRFDEDMLSLVDISESDFFDGYDTFFIANGTITYALILGKGNVSVPGNLVSITFEALAPGITEVRIIDVGVCNETGYVDIVVTNGTVHIAGMPVTPSRSSKQIKGGWTMFGNDIASVHGWTRFRNIPSQPPPEDTTLYGCIITAAASIIVVLMFFRRR